MKALINIRGANGSGKTTCVRDYLHKHKIDEDEIVLKDGTVIPTYICDDAIVLGKYVGNKTDGLDPFNGEKLQTIIICEAIKKYSPKPIIFESCTLSAGGKSTLRMASIAKNFGYDWIAVYLYLSWEERYKRLCERAGRPIKTFYVKSVLGYVEKAIKEIKSGGILVQYVDVSNILSEEMYLIVEQTVKKVKE